MGKRKVRRFAAMNSTGRRVKLDLFAEPSGDLGGSDVRDGVEREQQTEPNELPNSPSSSGQKTENPLLLLGQYSDDEVEEDATAVSFLANKKEQVDGLIQEGDKDTNVGSGADTTMQMADQQQTGEDSSALEFRVEGETGFDTVTNSTILDGLNKQTVPSVQASGSVSLEHHAPTDVTSQWKMILHEESNQYYYWNTETGETSWEIPAVLTQTASVYGTGYNESGPMVTDVSTLISGVEPSYLLPVQTSFTGTDCSTFPTVAPDERNKSEDLYVKSLRTDGHQVECRTDSVINTQLCQDDLARPENSDHVHTNFDTETTTDLPSRLLSQSEGLLEKLRSLKRSRGNFHSNEQISKYILEVEVRHSDVKALILDSSPLLSFWLHNIDMDVDMEVEESVPVSYVQVIDASDGKMVRTEPSNLQTDVPPPPGDEWIPPPPSESEDVPLPPPDSYSEPIPPPPENGDVPPSLSSDSLGVPYSVPQSYMQQSSDYATQYSLSYPESNYQYIGNAVALDPNTQFYGHGHVDGSQVSVPQSTYYYETVPGTSEVAPAAASASEAYYNYNGAAPLFPVISSVQSSLHHSGVASANYNIPSNSSTVAVPSSRSSDSAEIASLGTASQSTDVTGGSSLLAKAQTKVKRPKKRTVGATTSTLRSNKKVSSLVDKWKAAKEELNDSEEEEDDYGILDRKRQREIEEWKSRQIASGEAKDNANFQPIVGDWREKVKRKKERAEKSQKKERAEKSQNKSDEKSQKKADEKQQKPDLTKLSTNLPSGWQVNYVVTILLVFVLYIETRSR
ncbi:PREDICTED: uncharacterized protein LOC104704597 [Camelina sativa]|uniref:Uncharacterized protein LOC104704597 n=1 Tax=Camelina sativa TaxID=90675 RepID=A0ABM0T0K3_CAMSA|nr:PREDICTED: uncharacterized protein LOC104704597 [Camelina sativa]